MTNIIYNQFKRQLAIGTYRWTDQVNPADANGEVMFALMKTAADDVDDTVLSDVLSGKDYDDDSYTRPVLDSLVVVNDTTSNHSELTAANEVVTIAADGSEQVVGIVVYVRPGVSTADNGCHPVCYMDVTNFTGKGDGVTFVWNAEGLMKLV